MNKNGIKTRLIPVGKIVRTHGVRGALKVYAYGETLGIQAPGDMLLLEIRSGNHRPELTLLSLKPQGKLWLIQFREVSTMDEAQKLVGEELLIPEDRLPPAEEGEYYHYQLVGLNVETREGKSVGVLRGIIETPGNDVYVVDCAGKEVLVPAVEDVICEVDLKRGRMTIDLPEGLMDDL